MTLYNVKVKLEDCIEVEADDDEDAARQAIEDFVQSCNSRRWVVSNMSTVEVEEAE